MLRPDRTLANLFKYIDKHIGLKSTLIVLSTDHGGQEAPEYMKFMGIDSGHVSADGLIKNPPFSKFKNRFGIGK